MEPGETNSEDKDGNGDGHPCFPAEGTWGRVQGAFNLAVRSRRRLPWLSYLVAGSAQNSARWHRANCRIRGRKWCVL